MSAASACVIANETKTSAFNGRVILLWAALLVSIGLTVTQVTHYLNRRAQIEQVAIDDASQQATEAIAFIDTAFGTAMAAAQTVADELSSGALDYADIQARMRAEMADFPQLFGIAITFQPFVYDPDERLYQVYISRDEAGELDVLAGATYDYTLPKQSDEDPDTSWYTEPLENGAQWTDPFFAAGAQQVLIEYGVPFQQVDDPQQRAGVVTVDYTLGDMRELIARLDLGATGYGFVVTDEGRFLAHPVSEIVGVESLASVAARDGNESLAQVAALAEAGENFSAELIDPVTGQASWLFNSVIDATDWSLGIVLNQGDFAPQPRETLREQVGIALSAAAALWLAICVVLRVQRGTVRSLSIAAASFSLICLLPIMLVWYLDDQLGRATSSAITNQTILDSYLNNARNTVRNGAFTLLEVPTGVVVEAVDFETPTSATVNGLVWQRVHDDLPDDFTPGFRMTSATGPELNIEEVYRQRQGDETVIIWAIGLIVKQNFDPQLFPFDTRSLELRMEPLDLRGGIVLVPDLAGYELIAPSLRPGVDPDVQLYNWSIENSQYQYRPIPSASSFTLRSRILSPPTPSLYYVMTLRRLFFGPFIAYLLPGIIVALMIYAYLLRDRNPGNEDEIDNTLNYAAALFFVVIVSHTALRDNIAAVGITYLEYFYIVLYVGIAVVAGNDILIAKRPNALVIRYRNNLLPRLLFWPVMSAVLLLVTLSIFVFNSPF